MNTDRSYSCRVIGCTTPKYIDVIIGYGIGMLDGGRVVKIRYEELPPNCRMPNSLFRITDDEHGQIIKIEYEGVA